MTTPNTARLLRCLRQRITAVLRQVEAGEIDTAALLRDANTMSDAYHLAIASVLTLAYAEAGGVETVKPTTPPQTEPCECGKQMTKKWRAIVLDVAPPIHTWYWRCEDCGREKQGGTIQDTLEAGGVVVGDDKFSARIYEVPHGVGSDGKP